MFKLFIPDLWDTLITIKIIAYSIYSITMYKLVQKDSIITIHSHLFIVI